MIDNKMGGGSGTIENKEGNKDKRRGLIYSLLVVGTIVGVSSLSYLKKDGLGGNRPSVYRNNADSIYDTNYVDTSTFNFVDQSKNSLEGKTLGKEIKIDAD